MPAETREHNGQGGMTHQKRAPTPDQKQPGWEGGSNKKGRVQPVSHRRARRVTQSTHDRRRDERTEQTCVTQASAARPNDTVSRIVFICTQVPNAGGEHISLYMCPLALCYASLLLDSMYMIQYITPSGVKPRNHIIILLTIGKA